MKGKSKTKASRPKKPSTDPVKMAAKVFATMPGDGQGKPKLRLRK